MSVAVRTVIDVLKYGLCSNSTRCRFVEKVMNMLSSSLTHNRLQFGGSSVAELMETGEVL